MKGSKPLAVLEAKKPGIKDLSKAIGQATDYSERIGSDIVFVSNGSLFETLYLPNKKPLFLNGIEINEPIPLQTLELFYRHNTNDVHTISNKVIQSRKDLISIFSELNDELRAAGIRAGIERFNEFANILFLKLLSEKGDSYIWDQLLDAGDETVIEILNYVAVEKLRDSYGVEVLSPTSIKSPRILKHIITTLDELHLTSVDEDIKGVAFEHFIQRTTSTQNDLGEYFTPRHIVRFMVQLVNPKFRHCIYDPFCGTGGFLTESFKHLSYQVRPSSDAIEQLQKESVFGNELTTTARIAKMNMILFGDGHSGVEQVNSLRINNNKEFDYVLSNIPFSQNGSNISLKACSIGSVKPKDGDSACVLKCFKSLKTGGAMAIVVPDGFIYNNKVAYIRQYLFQHSRVRLIAHLPAGCFLPYTQVKTAIIYLTEKDTDKTDWFYRARINNDGYTLDAARKQVDGIDDLDKLLFFVQSNESPDNNFPEGLDIGTVYVENLESKGTFSLKEPWTKSEAWGGGLSLSEVASLRNGKSITKETTLPGSIPVIAGGRGTSPYTHAMSNCNGNAITVSKSGAYAGYVWWHDEPIWASDSIIIQSLDESKYLTRFLFLCMKSKQDEIYLRQQGTAQPHIYKKHLLDMPIPVVPLDDQRRFIREYEEANIKFLLAQKEAQNASEAMAFVSNSIYQ